MQLIPFIFLLAACTTLQNNQGKPMNELNIIPIINVHSDTQLFKRSCSLTDKNYEEQIVNLKKQLSQEELLE